MSPTCTKEWICVVFTKFRQDCTGSITVVIASQLETSTGTWKSQTAYKQLRHLVRHCQVVLQKADLQRRYEDALAVQANTKDELTLMGAEEQVEQLGRMMAEIADTKGELVWEGLFTPSQKTQQQVQLQLDGVSVQTERKVAREDLEHDEVPMACIACSY